MPKMLALVDYSKCRPSVCNSGTCAAALACPQKLLKQEALYEPPMPDPSICKGCGDCVRACPLKAVTLK